MLFAMGDRTEMTGREGEIDPTAEPFIETCEFMSLRDAMLDWSRMIVLLDATMLPPVTPTRRTLAFSKTRVPCTCESRMLTFPWIVFDPVKRSLVRDSPGESG